MSQDKYSSSFLKSGHDEVVIQDAAQDSKQEDDGICWISQQVNKDQPTNNNLQPIPSHSPEQPTENKEGKGKADDLMPKKFFSDSQVAAANQDDVDAQVIHKQEKTFEELLEMKL